MNQGGAAIKVNPTAVKGQMKGLLKGLRYISQIFDEENQDKEIQIGFPTDVKHLAHIGCDDAKATPPSWMTEFKEGPGSPGAPAAANTTKNPEGQGMNGGGDSGNNNNDSKGDGKRHHIRRSRHKSSDSQSSLTASPPHEGSSEGAAAKPRRLRPIRHSIAEEDDSKPPTTSTTKQHRRKSKTTSSEEKENSTRKPRTRRSSKGDSLSDISYTDVGPGH